MTSSLCEADASCLLVIDIQTRLTTAMPGKVLDRLKRNTLLLINTAKLLSVPVLATQQYPQGLGPIESEISEALPADCLHFEKTGFSCAAADNFMQKLNKLGRKQIILAGIESHICVLQTAMDLIEAKYDVFVVNDAVSSRHRENYENSLQRLQQAGVSISNAESVIFEWLRDSRHKHFKTISAMIR